MSLAITNHLPAAAVVLSSISASAWAANTLKKSFIYETQGMSCQERINAAKNNIQICPEAKAAWDRINKKGAVHCKCVAPSQAPRGGAADVIHRTILLAVPEKANEPKKRIMGQISPTSFMLYGLHNLESDEKGKDLFDKAANSQITLAQFQYEVEAHGFETASKHHEIAKKCQESGWDPDIAKQYDFGKDSPIQFTEEERRKWFDTSPIAKYIKPTDSDTKIKYIMHNDKIGHTTQVAQRLQQYLKSLEDRGEL